VKFDRESLIESMRGGEPAELLLFWGHTRRAGAPVGKECLSQWWPAEFEVDGIRYATAEHFMMASKARLFGDSEAEQRVLAAAQPRDAKRIGRQVRNFDGPRWSDACFDFVVEGNLAKFSQHVDLREFLLSTGDQILVEASPTDAIWGIGLAADDPRALDPGQWRGRNLLGFALTKVKTMLRAR
jgi:ribA/ribD-fused uncharacterized protein